MEIDDAEADDAEAEDAQADDTEFDDAESDDAETDGDETDEAEIDDAETDGGETDDAEIDDPGSDDAEPPPQWVVETSEANMDSESEARYGQEYDNDPNDSEHYSSRGSTSESEEDDGQCAPEHLSWRVYSGRFNMKEEAAARDDLNAVAELVSSTLAKLKAKLKTKERARERARERAKVKAKVRADAAALIKLKSKPKSKVTKKRQVPSGAGVGAARQIIEDIEIPGELAHFYPLLRACSTGSEFLLILEDTGRSSSSASSIGTPSTCRRRC